MKTKLVRAISLWEPYASSIAAGAKSIETRSWLTNYRGDLLIHAAKRPLSAFQLETFSQWKSAQGFEFELHPGCIVATCTLADCVVMTDELIAQQTPLEISLGEWQTGRYAWILKDVQAIAPIRARGAQGLWTPNPEIIREAYGQKQLSLLQ